jgi:hypothetical protein
MGAQTLAMARGYPPGLNIKIDNSIVEFLVAKVTARTHAKWPAGMRHCDLTQRCRLSLPSIPSPSTGGRGCMAHCAKRPRPARERDGRTALQLSTLGVHPFSGVPVLAACMLVCGRADFSAVGGAENCEDARCRSDWAECAPFCSAAARPGCCQARRTVCYCSTVRFAPNSQCYSNLRICAAKGNS